MTHDIPPSDQNELIAESEPLWEIDASSGLAPRLSTAELEPAMLELQAAAHATIEQLPDPDRQILRVIVRRLKGAERLDLGEIATESGLPISTVYRRAVNAMTLLHDRLSSDPVFQSYLEQHRPDLGLEPLGFFGRLLRSA